MPEPVIRIHGLSRSYGATLAVDNLSLQVLPGEIFGLLGHNGAGKTTTVRILNGLLAPDTGSVEVLGMDPLVDGPALRQRTGVLTETPSLDDRLSARANLRYYANLFNVPGADVRQRVQELLETFGLQDRQDERVANFSKGMKQRLALARALLHHPELIFLDEPSSGLDPVASRQIQSLILDLSRVQRRTVVLCTHNLAEAQKICDRVAVVQQGRLVAIGAPDELARGIRGGRRLQLETDLEAVHLAAHAIHALNGIGPIEIDRALITIADVPHERIPQVVDNLVKAGLPLYQVTYQEPTLEDVYFNLHESQPPVAAPDRSNV